MALIADVSTLFGAASMLVVVRLASSLDVVRPVGDLIDQLAFTRRFVNHSSSLALLASLALTTCTALPLVLALASLTKRSLQRLTSLLLKLPSAVDIVERASLWTHAHAQAIRTASVVLACLLPSMVSFVVVIGVLSIKADRNELLIALSLLQVPMLGVDLVTFELGTAWLSESRLVALAALFHVMTPDIGGGGRDDALPIVRSSSWADRAATRRARRRRVLALLCAAITTAFAYSTFYRHTYACALYFIVDGVGALADVARAPLRGDVKLQ